MATKFYAGVMIRKYIANNINYRCITDTAFNIYTYVIVKEFIMRNYIVYFWYITVNIYCKSFER